MRSLSILLFLLLIGAAVAWLVAGRADGPHIDITGPEVIGQTGEIAVEITAPEGELSGLTVELVQGGVVMPVFELGPGSRGALSVVEDRVTLTRPTGKRLVPGLEAGQAKITVSAARPVLFGLREASSTAERDVQVRLVPPQIAVLSRLHYVNHGGSEMVVYRVTPPDVESGVRVGEIEYPGFPASGAGIDGADPGLRVAFFALLWDQPSDTPIEVFARDGVGNEGSGRFDYRVFPKPVRAGTIRIDDRFLARVVPSILQNTPELRVEDPSDLLAAYLTINRDLRRMNDETIAALADETAPEILWRGPFQQLVNTSVEAGFADQRTYVYAGEDVDHQVHLGFDLASTSAAPVLSANRGRVVYAGWLGIYGNCVVVDHGMGLQSLYAHLSSIGVEPGEMVERQQQLGRSGATGLAGGDHLHFTMLLGGHAVTPVDWWSTKWVQDRVLRKLTEAGAEPGALGAGG